MASMNLAELVADLRHERNRLEPAPSLTEVNNAHKTIADIDKDLIEKLEKLIYGEPPAIPAYADEGQVKSLQFLREQHLREEAEAAKVPHVAIAELGESHRQYGLLIRQVERKLVQQVLSENPPEPARPSLPVPVPVPTSLPKHGERHFGSGSLPSVEFFPGDNEDSLSRSVGSPSSFWSITGENTVQKLQTIRESRGSLKCPPKLLQAIEQAINDKSERLDLSLGFQNSLYWIPDTLGEITSLTDLSLSSNQLLELPDTIGQLQKLTRLDVSMNQVFEIPQTLSRLSNLRVLNFQQNKLEEVPVAIGACQALEDLNLGFNNIRQLPESIGQLGELQRLHVHLNHMKTLPHSLDKLPNLTELDAHFNYLNALPDFPPSLKILNLSANHYELKSLPESIGQLTALEVLDVSENQIKHLPDSFVQLTKLRVLKLDSNPLRVPPPAVVKQGLPAIMEYMAQRNAPGPLSRRKSGPSAFRRFMDGVSGKKTDKIDDDEFVPPVMDPDMRA